MTATRANHIAPSRPIRVALVNDYEIVVRGLRDMLLPYANRVQVVELVANRPVDVPVDIALYDTFAQDHSALKSIRMSLGEGQARRLVIYTWDYDEELVRDSLAFGINGVLSKKLPAHVLVQALEAVHAGRTVVSPDPSPVEQTDPHESGDWPGRNAGLTMREAEMISLITQGFTNAEIAKRTYLSANTIKSYIRAGYRKIGVTRRSQAVAWGIENGLTPDRVRKRVS